MRTLGDILQVSSQYLSEKGLEQPRREAERLIMELLSMDRLSLYCDAQRPLHEEELAGLREGVRRRGAREPLAYILGYVMFGGLRMEVTTDTLIPRPETEQLGVLVAEELQNAPAGALLDLCTGSGCLANLLAHRLSTWRVCGSDVSGPALDVARRNGQAHQLSVEWRRGDLFLPWAGEHFEVIVSNPPYVAIEWSERLAPEVRKEPSLALFSGEDGLDTIRLIAEGLPHILSPGGLFFLEFGFDQALAVRKLFQPMGKIRLMEDLSGVCRFLRLEFRAPGG